MLLMVKNKINIVKLIYACHDKKKNQNQTHSKSSYRKCLDVEIKFHYQKVDDL